MDSATAGLIGALGGGIVGALGAWGAALITVRGTRYQTDVQTKASHDQWLRQIRRDLYAEFLSAARDTVHTPELIRLSSFLCFGPDREMTEEERTSLILEGQRKVRALRRLEDRIALELPPEVRATIEDLVNSLGNIVVTARWRRLDDSPPEWPLEIGDLSRANHALETLLPQCQASLQ